MSSRVAFLLQSSDITSLLVFFKTFYTSIPSFSHPIFHSFSKASMPGVTIDAFSRGNLQTEDRRDRLGLASSRPSYRSNDRYTSINGDRKRPHPHSCSEGDDKLSRENRWLQNSDSAQQSAATYPDESPPAYHEAIKVTAPSSSPRTIPSPPLQSISTSPRLQLPVIIPQNPRDGGFCRAYAPLLEECKVSQRVFFYFLDDFDRSAQASPYFSAVNIASIGSLNRPHSIAMIIALARQRYLHISPSLLLFP